MLAVSMLARKEIVSFEFALLSTYHNPMRQRAHASGYDHFIAQPPRLELIFQGKKIWGKNMQVRSGSLGTEKRNPRIEIEKRNHMIDWYQAKS